MGINFPASPAVGTLHPDPAQAGIPQYRWDGTVWTAAAAAGASTEYVKKAGDSMTGALTLKGGANNWMADSGGSGGYIGTITDPTRFYFGSDGAADRLRIYQNIVGNVLTVDGATGKLNFPFGATLPTATFVTDGNTNIANTAYVENRAAAWASLKLPLAGGSMTGNIYTNNSGLIGQAGAVPSIQVLGNQHAGIAFHCQGYFGANFGLANDGTFYCGGWSYGEGVYHRFWTTRNLANPLISTRLVYGADHSYTVTSSVETYPGYVLCGVDYSLIFRYRALQMQAADGGWYGVGLA